MTEPVTAQHIEEIVKTTMERAFAAARVEFDKELLGYAKMFEAVAELRPDIPEAPGYRAAAEMLRKALAIT